MDFLSGGFLFLIQSLARSTVPSKPLNIPFLVLLLFSGSLQENIEKKKTFKLKALEIFAVAYGPFKQFRN